MKKAFFLLNMLTVLAFVVINCGDDGTLPDMEEIGYPREVPFTEISLGSVTGLSWPSLDYDEAVAILNHSGNFVNYITYAERVEGPPFWNYIERVDDNFPDIDYSKHTLLVASGNPGHRIINLTPSLQQLSTSEYRLGIDIEIALLDTGLRVTRWCIALLVDKLGEESSVELNVTLKDVEGVI
jgi:hypothetical protein